MGNSRWITVYVSTLHLFSFLLFFFWVLKWKKKVCTWHMKHLKFQVFVLLELECWGILRARRHFGLVVREVGGVFPRYWVFLDLIMVWKSAFEREILHAWGASIVAHGGGGVAVLDDRENDVILARTQSQIHVRWATFSINIHPTAHHPPLFLSPFVELWR